MKQQSLASQGVFEKYGRKSRRELFLDEMEQVVPWSGLQSLVEPHYAKAGNGRRPVGLGIMLRTYFVQQWFSLSDPGGFLPDSVGWVRWQPCWPVRTVHLWMPERRLHQMNWGAAISPTDALQVMDVVPSSRAHPYR